MADTLKQTQQQTLGKATEESSRHWDAMTEEQKKQTFDSLPEEKQQGKTYVEWLKEGYQNQKENWMPWIEDMYLKWFTKDNKASYAAKDTLDKSKVTGVEQIDTLQDGVHGLVAGQVGQGGLFQPVGDMASKEGVNRVERKGKDNDGSYGVADPVVSNAKAGGEAVGTGAQSAGNTVLSGAKSAGGYVGGIFGGSKEEAK